MKKLYIRVRLRDGDVRHLPCKQPKDWNGADRDNLARAEIEAFIEREDKFASDWLPTAEGTYVARDAITDVTPVGVDADQPPWTWAMNDDRVLPLTQ